MSNYTNTPTFDGFINKHQAQIAEWPIKIETCDAQALHRAWVSRFNDAIRSTRKDISLKNTKYVASKWVPFIEEISLLGELFSTSRIEGQRLINKSVEQASNRSLRLLGNYGSTSESRTNTENEDDILTNLESDGEEEKEFEIDALFKIYYKKLNQDVFTEKDITFLKKILDKKSSIQDKVIGIAAQLLLKKNTTTQKDMTLQLSLSKMKIIDSIDMGRYVGLSVQSEELFERIIESGGKDVDTNPMMNIILAEQLYLNQSRLENSDQFKFLNILKCIFPLMIENTQVISKDDSEMSSYRHFAKILDYLFTGTDLKLLDGEPSCLSVKEEMIANYALYPTSVSKEHTFSMSSAKKIDAIVTTNIQKNRVELSTKEWKKSSVSSVVAVKQQSKNLRSNLSILNQLKSKYEIQTKNILAMDFVGYTGYMYNLVEKEGVYVPNLVTELILPTQKSEIKHVFRTINALFILKNHFVNLSAEANGCLQSRALTNQLKGIIRTKTQSASSSSQTSRANQDIEC
ncbi:hypothetical protein MFLAVUS_011128 [Mucor flavus]|uniref:Uncharacterized protein n=1 Tax=Mucor flavus TaxID=439312 RepID=A0ABP9ZEP0_9FUNG